MLKVSSNGTQIDHDTGATNTAQFPWFNQPSVIAKITEFHTHMDLL